MSAATESGLQVELLEASFAMLAPQAPELVDRFYRNLFAVAPEARAMFPDDMKGQKRALMGALGMIVNSLRAPEALGSYLNGLGERHLGYGAVDAHYDLVGGVLLKTMAEMAGPGWNEDLKDAWAGAYSAIKGVMLAGAAAAVARAA